MPLDASISGNNPLQTFRLQVKQADILYQFRPFAIPLPGRDPILLDFGWRLVFISLEGICSETGDNLSEDSVLIADKDDLEIIARDWWSNIIVCTISGDDYWVKVRSIKLTLTSGYESFWKYDLNLIGFYQPYYRTLSLLFRNTASLDNGDIDRTFSLTFLSSASLDNGDIDRTFSLTFLPSVQLDNGDIDRTFSLTFLPSAHLNNGDIGLTFSPTFNSEATLTVA